MTRSTGASLLLILAAFAVPADAADDRPVVVEVRQTVEKLDGDAAHELQRDQVLDYGDRLRSGPRAFAAIALGEVGVLDVGADSEKVVVRRNDSGEPEVGLERGRLIVALSRAFRGVFRIRSPIVSLALRGTLVQVLVLDDGTTRIWVYEGDVLIEELDVRVVQGTQILILPNRRVLPPSPISPWEPTVLVQDPRPETLEDPPLLDALDLRIFGKD